MIKLDMDMTLDELNALRCVSNASDERENFFVCPTCGQAVDCRRLGDVMHHDVDGHSPLPRH